MSDFPNLESQPVWFRHQLLKRLATIEEKINLLLELEEVRKFEQHKVNKEFRQMLKEIKESDEDQDKWWKNGEEPPY